MNLRATFHKLAGIAGIVSIFVLAGCASSTKSGEVGITRSQLLLVPAETIERASQASYTKQNEQARQAGRLVTSGAEYQRVNTIATRVRSQVSVFRDDAVKWNWSLALIDSPELNATCAPGGRITIYTGLIRQLSLTDDEIAAVIGHEIAHALREHGRERVSQAFLAQGLLQAASRSSLNANTLEMITKYLFLMPNSRENELEADRMGLELAARAGYDPQAAIGIWTKMAEHSKGKNPPEFLSTHPSHENRIEELRRIVPTVMPLYQAARRQGR